MKAAVHDVNGGRSVLRYADVPAPAPGPDDVLIRVGAISIEGGDILNRMMTPPATPAHIVGYSASGVVEAVGENVTRFKVKQRVAAFHWAGSHAEFFCVPENHVYPVPDGLDLDTASTFPVAFGTADDALFELGRLVAGETVLVNGGAGGVGLAAVQLAKATGARVIATTSGDERIRRLAGFGADEVIDYRQSDGVGTVLDLTAGEGVDLVVELAGGPGAASLMKAVRFRGRFAVVGASSGFTGWSHGICNSRQKGNCRCLSIVGLVYPRRRRRISMSRLGIHLGGC